MLPGDSHWENQRTLDAFDYEFVTGKLCKSTVSWLVEDIVPNKAIPGDYFAAFEPVNFSYLEGERTDGYLTHLNDSATFTEDKPYCAASQNGTDLLITSL